MGKLHALVISQQMGHLGTLMAGLTVPGKPFDELIALHQIAVSEARDEKRLWSSLAVRVLVCCDR
ncbi:hypothetical protein AHiyo4_26940 [Arthrobacter sp. Hiyo4]|nr:hypothetical protein AHiyo4_26940 [Arthrobacter sp. Hiyo4]